MDMLRKCFATFALVCVRPRDSVGQASITGVVRDSSGAVLPGVTVEASSPVLIEKNTRRGDRQLRSLPHRRSAPGTYSIGFALSGFTTVRREGVELTGTFVATINADLKVGAIAETITVSGETPVVDVQTARRETVLTGDAIANLPGTHAYGTLLNAIPA